MAHLDQPLQSLALETRRESQEDVTELATRGMHGWLENFLLSHKLKKPESDMPPLPPGLDYFQKQAKTIMDKKLPDQRLHTAKRDSKVRYRVIERMTENKMAHDMLGGWHYWWVGTERKPSVFRLPWRRQ